MSISNQKITYQIAQLEDVEVVYEFESKQKLGHCQDEIEKMILVWSSSFRKESLEHYFKTGWSFVAKNEQAEVVGFFLGQPLLFFDEQTQNLWIEHLSGADLSIMAELIDIAYRLAKEKHLQRVYFPESIQHLKLEKTWLLQKWERNSLFIKTTK